MTVGGDVRVHAIPVIYFTSLELPSKRPMADGAPVPVVLKTNIIPTLTTCLGLTVGERDLNITQFCHGAQYTFSHDCRMPVIPPKASGSTLSEVRSGSEEKRRRIVSASRC